MNYLTEKLVINERLLYLTIFLPVLLVGQVTTIVSAHSAELEMRRLDDGSGSLQKNIGMSGSELESFRLDRENLGVRQEDGLNQVNRPSLYSELESRQINTMNLGARLRLGELDAVRIETPELGYRIDKSIPITSGELVETRWVMMDPPRRTEEITFYDRDTKAKVTKDWGALKHEEILRLLSDSTDEVSVDTFDSEAKVSYLGLGSTTGKAGRYKAIMDFTSYVIEDVLNKEDEKYAHARVGVGLRVVADVTTKKANVDLNGLVALGAAVKAEKLSGTMTITKIGIVPKNDSGTMITKVTISEGSVLDTIAMLAVLRSKIKDESTHLDPQVIWVKPIPYQVKPPVPTKPPRWPTFGTKR